MHAEVRFEGEVESLLGLRLAEPLAGRLGFAASPSEPTSSRTRARRQGIEFFKPSAQPHRSPSDPHRATTRSSAIYSH